MSSVIYIKHTLQLCIISFWIWRWRECTQILISKPWFPEPRDQFFNCTFRLEEAQETRIKGFHIRFSGICSWYGPTSPSRTAWRFPELYDKYVDDDDILWLDVSMDNVMRMKIWYCGKKTSHNKRSRLLTELVILHSREEFPITAQLLHEVDVIAVTKHFVKLDYVKMLDVTQNFDFSHQLGHETLRRDCFFLDSFQTNYEAGGFMKSYGDLAELALAYVLEDFEIVENRIVP